MTFFIFVNFCVMQFFVDEKEKVRKLKFYFQEMRILLQNEMDYPD